MKKTKKNIKTSALDDDIGQEQQLQSEQERRSLWNDPFIHILLILAAGFIVYFNTINVPFIFDDHVYLIKNPVIKSFDCFPDSRKVFDYAINQDIKNNLILRPVAYFTFAVNYALHGFGLFGYHIVNLLLHIGCGMLVYYFFVQLLQTPAMAADKEQYGNLTGEGKSHLPLFAALLFVCHPLQTQAVTYIIQRFIPLATFFYLASLVLYVLSRCASTPKSRVMAYFFSIFSAVLAMESKEIAFTLPVIIVLVEFMFFRDNTVQRLVRLIPFILTMAIIPAKLLQLATPESSEKAESVSSAINLVNFGGISSWDYLITQFGVIMTYIRLLFLPVGQNFDYDIPLQKSFFNLEVLLPLALLLIIVLTGFYLLNRSRECRLYKIMAFGIFWFFITLSVESSIVPIDDLIFEHRAYLPSVGFFFFLLAGSAVLFNRWTNKSIERSKTVTFLLVLTVFGFSAAAIVRNLVWQDEVIFWKDVVKKSPNKARPYVGLGNALMQQSKYVPAENDKDIFEEIVLMKAGSEKQTQAAINAFKEAIRIEPKNPLGHRALAEALMLQKNYDEALRSLLIASELQPKSSIPYAMRGAIFEAKNDFVRARQEYLEAVKVEPSSYMPHLKLANIYAKEGNHQDAIKELEFVMRIYPDESVLKKLERLKKK